MGDINNINTTGSLIFDFLGHSTNRNHSNILSTTPAASNATRIDLTKNIIIPAGMFFIGVFGNVTALVILSVRPSKVSRSTAFYNLVKALAVIDLIGITALSPVTIAVYIKGGVLNTGGMALCHYFSGGLLMAGTSTLFIVLVMAAERFLVTKFPFHYGVLVTHTRVNIVIAMIVFLSVFGALLPVVGFSHNVDPWPGTWCFFDYRSTDVGSYIYSISYALVGFLVLIVTIVFNAVVIQHLWHMRKSRLISTSVRSTIRTATSVEEKQTGSPDNEKRMVIFLMAITIVFTVCYTPLMVRVVMNQIWNAGRDIVSGGIDDKLDLWVIRLASLNQLLDPWVYIISRFTCCRKPRERSNSQTMCGSPSCRTKNGKAIQNKPESAEKDTRFGKSLRTVRKLFSNKNGQKRSDSAMKPLQADVLMSQCSTTNASSPLTRSPDRSDVTRSSKESEETEKLCLNTNQHQV